MPAIPLPNLDQISETPIEYAPFPSEGPRCVPITLNFALAGSYSLDLTALQMRGVLSGVQTLYVDNSAGTTPLAIVVNQSGQTLTVPAGAQGYFPVLVPIPTKFIFTSASAVSIVVWLLNIPVSPALWFPNATQQTFSAGKLLVSDPILDAAITNNLVGVNPQFTGSGGTTYPNSVGNLVANGFLTATGLSAALITGNGGYFLDAMQLDVSSDATLAVAGPLLVTAEDSSTGIVWQGTFFVPAAAGTVAQTKQTPASFWWNNKVANSTLKLRLSAALTAGKMYYNLSYGIAAFVG